MSFVACCLLLVAFGWAFSTVSCLGRLGLYFVGFCSWFGVRCRDCPRLGQSLFAAPKSNQKSLLNTHGGTPCAPLALRSDSRRESEFLWGSALRFARVSYFVLGAFFVFCPLLILGFYCSLNRFLLAKSTKALTLGESWRLEGHRVLNWPVWVRWSASTCVSSPLFIASLARKSGM